MENVRVYEIGKHRFITNEQNRVLICDGRFASRVLHLVSTQDGKPMPDVLEPNTPVYLRPHIRDQSAEFAHEFPPMVFKPEPVKSVELMPAESYSAAIAMYTKQMREYETSRSHILLASNAAIAKVRQEEQEQLSKLHEPTLDDLF